MSKHHGEIVKAYRNLHNTTGTGYSLKHKKRDRVISKRGGVQRVTLENATFQVSEKTRQRVINERKKYVHAYVVGTLTQAEDYIWPAYSQRADSIRSEQADLWTWGWRKARYNPFNGPDFTLDGHPLAGAEKVKLCASGMWVLNPRFKNQ